VAVPAVADAIAAGRPLRAGWVNEIGGVTFSIARGPDGFAEILFDAYGVTADTERIAYYRRSWD
jgi:hypothetical protein